MSLNLVTSSAAPVLSLILYTSGSADTPILCLSLVTSSDKHGGVLLSSNHETRCSGCYFGHFMRLAYLGSYLDIFSYIPVKVSLILVTSSHTYVWSFIHFGNIIKQACLESYFGHLKIRYRCLLVTSLDAPVLSLIFYYSIIHVCFESYFGHISEMSVLRPIVVTFLDTCESYFCCIISHPLFRVLFWSPHQTCFSCVLFWSSRGPR